MLRGREPRAALAEGFPRPGEHSQTSTAGVHGGRERLGWGGGSWGDPGREGWFGEGEGLAGLAGEDRLVEVWGEKVTVECGDSESSPAGVMGWSWEKTSGGRATRQIVFQLSVANEQRWERL